MASKFFILVICIITINRTAQTQSLTTDMPRQNISVQTIPKKWLQLETGIGIKINEKSFEKTTRYSLPYSLFRYGLNNILEARVRAGVAYSRYHFWNTTVNRKSDMWGSGPIEIGGKLRILKERKRIPSISFTAHYRFNNNLRLSTDTIIGGNFRFSFQNRLSENFQLDYSAGIDWISWKSHERYVYTLSPVLHFNEKWSGYLEASGIIWDKNNALHFVRAGGAYRFNENASLNLICGRAWNNQTKYVIETFPNGEFALQFAWRFNTASK